jgi:hypothetical protein
MKKLLVLVASILIITCIQAQEYLIVTTVESVVPAGIGRSRMIVQQSEVDVDDMTTDRTDGKTSKQKDVKRKDAKIDKFEETKLLNFFSIAGINFQNVASNDALITDKINKLAKDGWKLVFVTSGVESDAGKDDGNGIFITRFIFMKP